MKALRDARFRRLFAGQSLSSFGDTALYLTLGIWAKSLTQSNAAAGAVFLALGIPSLFGPLAGHLADRVRRKQLMMVTQAVTGLVVLSLLAVRSEAELWIIYLVAFSYGVSFSVLNAAASGLLKDLLPDEALAGANAVFQTAYQGLRLLSPLAGAGIYVTVGGGALALLDAATFAISIALLASMRVTESAPGPSHGGSFLRDVTAGFRHLRSVPLLAQVTLATACAFSVLGLSESIVFAVVGDGLHRAPSFMGVLMSVQGGGSIAGGLTAAALVRRAGPGRAVGLALLAFALASVGYRFGSVPLVLAGSVGDGLGVVWLTVGFMTAIQRYTPPRLQGRVTATGLMLIVTPQTASIAVGTSLISFVDYRVLLAVITAVTAACALLLLAHPASAGERPPVAEPGPAARAGTRLGPGEPLQPGLEAAHRPGPAG